MPTLEFPTLATGETYAGILIKDGSPSHHLILLPGEANSVTHQAACEWAASIGGELPSRKEQALLFANAAEQFERTAYWSAALYESDPDDAWSHYFYYGYPRRYRRYDLLRARAVRRLPI